MNFPRITVNLGLRRDFALIDMKSHALPSNLP
ncbi:hypothetical protein HOV93_33190 [Planctomycetes bacterium FF15]|uniref:Uncharacterized protein n=1 Tax=Bremerella alba TaxID=980252 RepID=A0A7V8V760_9BACT|nr:hypothetical protein [Bremerella alba]